MSEITPVTHLEKTIAGEVQPVTHLEKVIAKYGGGGGGGTSDYSQLSNKPKINNVELDGNKSLEDIGAQPTIDSSHKLSADNVDDTNATNKFATAAELEQIETNKNNILSEQAKTTGMTDGGSNYITVGGIRVYVSATAPTGARTGDLWIGG